MNIKLIFLLTIVILRGNFVYSQGKNPAAANTLTQSWRVVDRGGGKSVADTLVLRSSIGQPVIQKMEYIDTGIVLECGFLPGLRTRSGGYTSHQYSIAQGWNLLNIPLIVQDARRAILFATSASDAFAYEGTYTSKDTLNNGTGYWLKYDDKAEISIMGTSYIVDTVNVNAGWNMIGSLSYPTLVSDVVPIPPLTITSDFFKYEAGYISQDTLQPGTGYWIKASTIGKVVFNASTLLLNNNLGGSAKTEQTPNSESPD